MTRPSWYLCCQCKQPHTEAQPLVRVYVRGAPQASWDIHEGCRAALQEALRDGVVLVNAG